MIAEVPQRKYFDAISFYQQSELESKYPLLIKLARALLSLPYSSASVERAFSQLKLIKDDKRSTLANDTLESLLTAKINDYDFDDNNLLQNLCAYYEKSHPNAKKRKYAEITQQLADSVATDEHKNPLNIMEIETAKDLTDNFKKMKFTTATMSNTFSDEIHCNLNDNDYASMPDFTTSQPIVRPLDIVMEDDKERSQKAKSKTAGKNVEETMKKERKTTKNEDALN